ncbi:MULTISPECIES: class I SAM-dependent methyltransferase [Halomicrobium]|uniref:Methyltransferase type 11 n=2 Tax=Halomicrobium mukohataei TaxID=57705 RepID=C7NY49_HALMD|nr:MULTISPECIES: class I SAM-dependent methyltransferase [Halomicrobium]ACV48509.1 Methyltransferase type 11 [Halomicrobium mukohataei DSM 12286]QCD66910.1 class I SAM-dependent methyltransferase [Halomicrobium mukohataei]QFR21720.1 methyltransferase domain-containing protein [Halomicrobium sp. ZPS1]
MKRSIDEHADRFSDHAADYDESQDSEEYRECADLVVRHAAPAADDVVLDLGTGTGAIALPLADAAAEVVGRDISEGMLEQARTKATERGIDNVSFGEGRFREPSVDREVDVVTSNFAMHHLDDEAKREAIDAIAALEPRRFVLGDVMFFDEPDPSIPFYDPSVDDPATVGVLADAFTDAGFALTAVEMVHGQVGVLVGERVPDAEAVDQS